MFQDSNKEYTGSGAGVAGSKPATPVSLSAAQEASVQAATLAALQQLQQQRTIANIEATQAQLTDLARQAIATQQGSLDVARLVDLWRQNAAQVSSGSASSVSKRGEASSINAYNENYSSGPVDTGSKNKSSSVQTTPVSQSAGGVPVEAEASAQSSDGFVDEGDAEGGDSVVTGAGVEQSEQEPQAETTDLNETSAQNSEQDVNGSQQPSLTAQTSASDTLTDNQTKGSGDTLKSDASAAGQEAVVPDSTMEEPTAAAGKAVPNEAPVSNQAPDTPPAAQEPGVNNSTDSGTVPASQVPTAPTGNQSLGNGKESEAGPSSPAAGANQLHGEPGDPRYKREGLPTGARDRFKRGLEDKKSGESFKNAYSARKLPPGGSAVKGLGEGAAKGIAQEGTKDVAKAAVKEGTKDAAKVGAKFAPGVDLASDIDLKGAIKTAKDLKDLKVGAAAKDAAKSITVTLFRVSYDPWVIGFTVGLSLIVTLLVGSFLFFMPSSSISILERLLIVALWILLGFIVLLVLGLLLVGLCNGPQGLAIWGASFFSKTAADINKFCEPIGALQAATKNVAR